MLTITNLIPSNSQVVVALLFKRHFELRPQGILCQLTSLCEGTLTRYFGKWIKGNFVAEVMYLSSFIQLLLRKNLFYLLQGHC